MLDGTCLHENNFGVTPDPDVNKMCFPGGNMFCFQNKSSNVITLLNTPEYSLRFKPKVVTRVGWITCFFGRCS